MKDLFGFDYIANTIEQIRLYEPPEGYYLAFSGGKDSVVIYDLAVKSGVKYDAHYNITTADPPELVKFIRSFYPDVIFERPRETMWQIISRHYMPPTRIVRYCCEELKERGGDGRVVMTGVRAEESRKRLRYKQLSPCNKTGKVVFHPILFWTTAQVWEYIEDNNLPTCELYRQGFNRLGCIGCPMSYNKKRELEMYPKIKGAYLRAFGRMLENRKIKGKKTTWQTPEEVMEWWTRQ